MAILAFAAVLPLILAEDSPAAMLRGSQLATRNLERLRRNLKFRESLAMRAVLIRYDTLICIVCLR